MVLTEETETSNRDFGALCCHTPFAISFRIPSEPGSRRWVLPGGRQLKLLGAVLQRRHGRHGRDGLTLQCGWTKSCPKETRTSTHDLFDELRRIGRQVRVPTTSRTAESTRAIGGAVRRLQFQEVRIDLFDWLRFGGKQHILFLRRGLNWSLSVGNPLEARHGLAVVITGRAIGHVRPRNAAIWFWKKGTHNSKERCQFSRSRCLRRWRTQLWLQLTSSRAKVQFDMSFAMTACHRPIL